MSDLSNLSDGQLQANITATQKQFNTAIKSKKPKDKIKASKLKKRLDELKQEQANRKNGVKSLTTTPSKKHTIFQRKNNKIPAKKYKCRFKPTDKILVISIDDLNDPKKIGGLIHYLKMSKVPVTLFPHSGADANVLQKIRVATRTKQGWHGIKNYELDANPLPGTDKSVIAWSFGKDGEDRKSKLGKDTIARGTDGNQNPGIGKFDQHEMPSVSLGIKGNNNIKNQVKKILKSGGVLSVHLHHDGDGWSKWKKRDKKKNPELFYGAGVLDLKDTVEAFKKNNGKIIFMEELKGCGK